MRMTKTCPGVAAPPDCGMKFVPSHTTVTVAPFGTSTPVPLGPMIWIACPPVVLFWTVYCCPKESGAMSLRVAVSDRLDVT